LKYSGVSPSRARSVSNCCGVRNVMYRRSLRVLRMPLGWLLLKMKLQQISLVTWSMPLPLISIPSVLVIQGLMRSYLLVKPMHV
jgi:hypothetical protein